MFLVAGAADVMSFGFTAELEILLVDVEGDDALFANFEFFCTDFGIEWRDLVVNVFGD